MTTRHVHTQTCRTLASHLIEMANEAYLALPPEGQATATRTANLMAAATDGVHPAIVTTAVFALAASVAVTLTTPTPRPRRRRPVRRKP